MAFNDPLPFTETTVVNLAQAAPHDGSLAVTEIDSRLMIVGFSAEGSAPPLGTRLLRWFDRALLVGLAPYGTFAVADGRANPIVRSLGKLDLPAYLLRVLGKNASTDPSQAQRAWRECRAIDCPCARHCGRGERRPCCNRSDQREWTGVNGATSKASLRDSRCS